MRIAARKLLAPKTERATTHLEACIDFRADMHIDHCAAKHNDVSFAIAGGAATNFVALRRKVTVAKCRRKTCSGFGQVEDKTSCCV